MEQDILPDLLAAIEKEFDARTYNSEKLKELIQLLSDKKATYLTVNDFAIEIGEILSEVFTIHVTTEVLPDGRMYFNIADRLLNATLSKNHELITSFGVDVQAQLNQSVGIRIKGQVPEINQDKVDGLINKISDAPIFDDVKWLLNEPIINFSQSIVDSIVKENADFLSRSGFDVELRRRVANNCCGWCRSLEGTYDYYDLPDDVFRRHRFCRCTVEYQPRDQRGLQNSHTKKWRDPNEAEKIEERKYIGL